jgi:hypothetical protein
MTSNRGAPSDYSNGGLLIELLRQITQITRIGQIGMSTDVDIGRNGWASLGKAPVKLGEC